jgi:hypothetical protein
VAEIDMVAGCRMNTRISGSCPRSQCSMTKESKIGCGFSIPYRDKGSCQTTGHGRDSVSQGQIGTFFILCPVYM